MSAPQGILCTKSHEYIIEDNNEYKIGLTSHAVEQLGDIVFVELPEVDSEFSKGEVFGTIESVKAASEMYLPVAGKVLEINEKVMDEPEIINNDNYGEGWFMKIEVTNSDELNELMEYEDYLADIEE